MIVTYEDAKKAAASIRKAVNPCSVVLFGSVAREGSGNELDLLIQSVLGPLYGYADDGKTDAEKFESELETAYR